MNNEKLILEVYNKTINNILNSVSEKYKNELSLAYMDYLKRIYLSFDFELENNQSEELIKTLVNFEISKWKDVSESSILSELLNDQAFENIKYISNTGYKYAMLMLDKKSFNNDNTLLQPVIEKEKALESIELLNSYYEQVRDFNKTIANYYVSEGSIDFQYASGITENMSLRIGRLKK